METLEIRKRVMAKTVLSLFVEGRINTQKDVDILINKIRRNFNMTAEQAGMFLKDAIQ